MYTHKVGNTLYKAGDKIKVVNMPPGIIWWNPTTKDSNLKNGDILELNNPLLHSLNHLRVKPNGYVPIDWIEPYTEENTTQICKCNLWTTGCVCGVFKREKSNG